MTHGAQYRAVPKTRIERFRNADYPRRASRGKGEGCDHMKDFLRDIRRVTLLFDSMGKRARGIEFLTSLKSLEGFPIAIFVTKSFVVFERVIRIEMIRAARMPHNRETGRNHFVHSIWTE